MDMLKSKKFQTAIVSVIVMIAGKAGFDIEEETLLAIVSPLLVYIAGQGLADVGKEKEKVKAQAQAQAQPR